MLKSRIAPAIIATCVVAACTGRLNPVYHIDINQGNAVDQEEIDKLEIGMSPAQVRYILGNPLVNDGFHTDRWDYLHYLRRGSDGKVTRSHLTVFFKDDKVSRIDRAEVLPPDPAKKAAADKAAQARSDNSEKSSAASTPKPSAAPAAAQQPTQQSPAAPPSMSQPSQSVDDGSKPQEGDAARQSQDEQSKSPPPGTAVPASKPGFLHRLIWPEKKPKPESTPEKEIEPAGELPVKSETSPSH